MTNFNTNNGAINQGTNDAITGKLPAQLPNNTPAVLREAYNASYANQQKKQGS